MSVSCPLTVILSFVAKICSFSYLSALTYIMWDPTDMSVGEIVWVEPINYLDVMMFM